MTHGTLRCLAVVTAVAFILMASLPAASADAHEAKESFSGMHFVTSEKLSQTDIDRLYDDRDHFAYYAMMALLMDMASLNPHDTVLSAMSIEVSAFDSVSGNTREDGRASVIEMDITFTLKGEGSIFSLMDEDLIPLYELFGRNELTDDDRIEVSGHMSLSLSSARERSYERNRSGDFVLTSDELRGSFDIRMEGAKLRFFDGEESKGEVTVESRVRDIRNELTEVTFPDNEVEDTVAGTYVYNIMSLPGCYALWDFDYSGDAEGYYMVYFTDDEYRDYHESELSDTYGTASILYDDIAAGTIAGIDLFKNVGDPSLDDDSALRAYLSSIGTLTDSFSEAKGLYRDISKAPKESNVKRVMLIGAIGVMVTVAALGILFFYTRRN